MLPFQFIKCNKNINITLVLENKKKNNKGKKSKIFYHLTYNAFIYCKDSKERGVEGVFKMPVELCVEAWKI